MLFKLFSCTFHVAMLFSCLLLFIVYVFVFSDINVFFEATKVFFHHHDHRAAIYGTIAVGMATYPAVATDPDLRTAQANIGKGNKCAKKRFEGSSRH